MKPNITVTWDWLDAAGQLRWEVFRNGRTMAASGGFVSARQGLMALLDLADQQDEAGNDEVSAAIMNQWAEIAWEIRDRVDVELREALEEACEDWWDANADDD